MDHRPADRGTRPLLERYPAHPNLPAMMFACARAWSGRTLFRHHRADGTPAGAWVETSWAAFARMAASAARGLRRAGVAAGDRVLVVSENRPELVAAEVALMAIRAVPVPAYVTNTAADHAHVLRDCGARAAIVSGPALAARLRQASALLAGPGGGAGPLALLVAFDEEALGNGEGASTGGAADGTRAGTGRGVGNAGGGAGAVRAEAAIGEGAGGNAIPGTTLPWSALTADPASPGDPASPDDIAAESATIRPGAMACLLYSSGTSGAPRGVMLPHRAILANCRSLFEVVRPMGLGRETYLSFLPASHAFEHTVGLFFFPSLGFEVVFSRGLEHLAADLLAVRPSVVAVVPRLLEGIRTRVLGQVARQPAWRRALFARTLAAGGRRLRGRATPLDRLLHPALDRLVAAKVRARFGGRLITAVCGAARLEPEVTRFFAALGLPVMQGYGQTEAGPVISVTPYHRIRPGSVGRALPGVALRLAEDGEVLVQGDLVMDGYWNRPDATAEAVRDGWLHTGDVGTLDADGYLHITDRKRDLIVLSGGENVAPARIESLLVAEPEIAQAVVAGDGRSALAALLVPAAGCDAGAVAAAVARVNRTLGPAERVRRHALVPPFTLENGLLTPTHKVRRRLVLAEHASVLAALG